MPHNGKRSLDKLLRTLRGTMRTHDLARPDRLAISTRSGSVHLELTSGTARDRVAGLLGWAELLHGEHLVWTHSLDGGVHIAATGTTTSGITAGITATVTVADLGGHLITTLTTADVGGYVVDLDEVTVAVVPGLGRLELFECDAITLGQLRRVLAALDSRPAVPVSSPVSEVAA